MGGNRSHNWRDLSGRKFGRLTVIEFKGTDKNQHSVWLCRCECGRSTNVITAALTRGQTTSCGCYHSEVFERIWKEHELDRTGKRYGYLTAISPVHKRRKGGYGLFWLCRCDCGEEKIVRGCSLGAGTTTSCGCHRYDNVRKRPYEALYNELLNAARKSRREINITYDLFVSLTSIDRCYYCLDKIVWRKHGTPIKGSCGYNLDRANNALGYSKYNCVVCCGKCNRGKSNVFTYDEWFEMTKPQRKRNFLNMTDLERRLYIDRLDNRRPFADLAHVLSCHKIRETAQTNP